MEPISIALLAAAGLAGLRGVQEWASTRIRLRLGNPEEPEPTVQLSAAGLELDDLENLEELMQKHDVAVEELPEETHLRGRSVTRPRREEEEEKYKEVEPEPLPLDRTFPRMRSRGVSRATVQLVVQIAITIVVLGAALYIILGGSSDNDTQNWAFGAAGAIVGYWLSGPTR